MILAGVLLRVGWSLARPDSGAAGEAFNVARAFAEGRGFADAYRPGQGPTAHLLPTSPLVAGLVYSALGIRSWSAELVLGAWSLLLVFGSFLLFFRAFGRLGVPRAIRIGCLAFLCLSPAYIAQEAVDFRVWEGGLAVALLALLFDRLTHVEESGRAGRLQVVTLSVGLALLCFVNPPLGLAGGVCALLLAWRRLNLAQTLLAAGISLAVITAIVAPWALRNEARLGELVLARSNMGLELAIGQHEAAWSNPDRGRAFSERLEEVHPAVSATAYAAMQAAGGEVSYSRQLSEQSWRWMQDNPTKAAQLMLRHVRQTVAPEPWQFGSFGSGRLLQVRSVFASLAGIAGLVGLAVGLARRPALWMYPALLAVVTLIALSPFQPAPRYCYLLYALLVYSAGPAIEAGWRLLKGRISQASTHM